MQEVVWVVQACFRTALHIEFLMFDVVRALLCRGDKRIVARYWRVAHERNVYLLVGRLVYLFVWGTLVHNRGRLLLRVHLNPVYHWVIAVVRFFYLTLVVHAAELSAFLLVPCLQIDYIWTHSIVTLQINWLDQVLIYFVNIDLDVWTLIIWRTSYNVEHLKSVLMRIFTILAPSIWLN